MDVEKISDNILENIHKAILKLLVPLNPQETHAIIVEEAIKLIKGNDGLILHEEKGELKKTYASSKEFLELKIRKRGHTYKSFKSRKAFVIGVKDFAPGHGKAVKKGVKSVIFIPLSYKNKSFGVLLVRSHSNENFTDKELNILKLYGSMASMAIRKTQLYDEAKKALEVRDSFIPLAAHELRTPLTSIHGYIQLLHGRLAKEGTTEARWIQELLRQSNRLTALVKEILEINRLRAGQLQYVLHEGHFGKIVDSAIARFYALYPDRKIQYNNTIKKSCDSLICDAEKITDVLVALLDNAAKFSSTDSSIEVGLSCKKSNLHLTITDYGKGISKQDLPKIFEGFYKGKDNHTQGLGVGLLLAKHILAFHQGEIQITSNKSGGTIAKLSLPRTEEQKKVQNSTS